MGYNVKKCEYCGTGVDKHKKCKECFILLHIEDEKYQDENGKQHGLEGKYSHCVDCS